MLRTLGHKGSLNLSIATPHRYSSDFFNGLASAQLSRSWNIHRQKATQIRCISVSGPSFLEQKTVHPPKPKHRPVKVNIANVNLSEVNKPPTLASEPPKKVSRVNPVEIQKIDIADAQKHGILKPPPEGADWFRRTLHQLLELAKFYYRGAKLVYSNRKQAAIIKQRVRDGGSPLTRSEFRFIQTTSDDIVKVVPFVLIALILEEILPLIVLYAPFMLPSTCILPSQSARITEKSVEKAAKFSTQYRQLFHDLAKSNGQSSDILRDSIASTAFCGVLGIRTWGLQVQRRRRIEKHFRFIAEDDRLLAENDSLSTLTPEELDHALRERGILSDVSPSRKLTNLRTWVDSVQSETGDALSRRLTAVAIFQTSL